MDEQQPTRGINLSLGLSLDNRRHRHRRRRLLVGTAAFIAMKVARASSSPLVDKAAAAPVGGDGPDTESEPKYTPNDRHLTLDLVQANRIAAQFSPDDFLDLTAFTTASPEALRALADLDPCFAELGFTTVDTDTAALLAGWKSYFLSFPRLPLLTADAAGLLDPTAHALDFPAITGLDVATAKALVGYPNGNASLLSLGLIELSPAVASVLAFHDHELDLRVPCLSLESATALAGHRGYRLHVLSATPFPVESIHAFSGLSSSATTMMKQLECDGPILAQDPPWSWWSLKFDATPAWWGARTATKVAFG